MRVEPRRGNAGSSRAPFAMRFRILALALAACSLIAAASPSTAQTKLRRGLVGAIETLDPQKAATFNETAILTDLFEGLVTRDALGRPVPGAAESWTASTDGLVYTFKLRDGARWSSGEAVKAADFVASFRRLFDPETGATEDGLLQVILNAAAIKSGIAKVDMLGVKAIDASTLEITLEQPTPTFPARLALPAALPVNVASMKKLGAEAVKSGKIISNGPYRVGAIDRANGYVLLKNARFRLADDIAVDSVTYRPFESAADCVSAYRSADVETCADVPAGDLVDLKTEFGPALHIAPYAGTYFFVFNTAKKPFDDVRVRRALSISIDRDALAAAAWSGGMVPAQSLVPAELAAMPAQKIEPIEARRNEAKSLLAEAGFGEKPGDRKLSLVARVGTGAAHEDTARLVAEQWKTIGVEATIRTEPNTTHFARLRDGGDFDLARAGWILDEADPLDILSLLRGDSPRFNYARYENVEFDRTLDHAMVELDPAARLQVLADAEAVIERDAPVIPLLAYASLSLVSPTIAGWHNNVLNLHPSRFLSLKP